MSFLDFLTYRPPLTGYVPDDQNWLRSLPKHSALAGGIPVSTDWSLFAPPFRYQENTMMCTAFAACNALSMLYRKESGDQGIFSPLELFVRAQGTTTGNTVQNTCGAMQQGLVFEDNCPWVGPVTDWDAFVLKYMEAYVKAQTEGNCDSDLSIKGLTNVLTNRASLMSALYDSPLLAIVNVSRGYFTNPAPAVSSGSLHAVVITKVMADGKIQVFDSLEQSSGFDGFHWLSSDFPILYAFGFMDIAGDWKKKQDLDDHISFGDVLARYGKPQDPLAESNAANQLKLARAQNPTHASFLDQGWQVYVDAIAYGHYTVTDVLNQITCIRRGLKLPFDLNHQKI